MLLNVTELRAAAIKSDVLHAVLTLICSIF